MPTEKRFHDQLFTRDFDLRVELPAATTRAEGEPEEDRIPIAISSEYGVERYDWERGEWYLEVLSHEPADINLDRARNGMPFLFEHASRVQLGLVEEVAIGADRRLRGVVRKGNHPDAEWVTKDMRAGIRPSISVGYRLSDEYEQSRDAQGRLLRIYRGWQPMEASSVSIPADPDGAGVNRSAGASDPARPSVRALEPRQGKKEETVSEKTQAPHDGAEMRTSEIVRLCAEAGFAELTREFVESDKSPVEVGRVLLAKANERYLKATTETKAPVTLTEEEDREFSIARAVQSLMAGKREGFEFEVSAELERKGVTRTRQLSVLIPSTIRVPGTRTLVGVSISTKGQELKFTEYGGFIDMLKAAMLGPRLGVQMRPGLQGDIAFVRQTGAGTFSWLNGETNNPAASSPTLEQRTMAPKPCGVNLPYTRQFLRQSYEAVEPWLRGDLVSEHAIGLERAWIAGAGSAGVPRGITGVVGIGSVAGGANGLAPTYDHMVDLQREVAIDNAMLNPPAYLTTPQVAARLKKTQKFATTNGQPVWEGSIVSGNIDGLPAYASTLVPSNLTKGTSTTVCHAVLFGGFEQVVIGEWGAIEIFVDELTSGPSTILLKSYQMVDVMVRHPEAFSAMLDALP